jgi:hypothetical protein
MSLRSRRLVAYGCRSLPCLTLGAAWCICSAAVAATAQNLPANSPEQTNPPTPVLVADTLNGVVRAYEARGTNWTYTGEFAAGAYAGQLLTVPHGLAQDTNNLIYVSEAGGPGRVLRFEPNGTFLDVIGTNGVTYSGGNPQALLIGPDGNLFLSLAFVTPAENSIWKYDIASGGWNLFVPNSGAGYSLNTSRGLAFGPDGNLCVADRQNNFIRKFNGVTGAFMSNLVSATRPQALYWDGVNNQFLMSRTFNGVIEAITPNGVVTPVYSQTGTDGFLDVERIEGAVAFTRYDSDRVDVVTGPNSAMPVATFLDGPGHLLAAKLPPRPPVTPPGCPPLPGIPIKYSPKSTGLYLGSPAIVILPNGDYLASHDYFGPGSSQSTLGQTFLYRSTNRGTNWTLLGQINQMVSGSSDDDGQFWNHFIQFNGELYAIGNSRSSGGRMVIRRAANDGALWTEVSPDYGQPFPSVTWNPGHTYVFKHDRIWLSMERGRGVSGDFGDTYVAAMFAPINSDLLASTNWSVSTTVERNTAWLGGTFKGWLEGNIIEDRLGGMLIMLRVDNRYANGAGIGGKAALVRVVHLGGNNASTMFSGAAFDSNIPQGSGFVDFPGGTTRFTVRFDPVSDRYWTLCNYIPRAFRNDGYNAERFRGILVLASSPDLKDWTVERILMADWRIYSDNPTVAGQAFMPQISSGQPGLQTRFGFQYTDWVFDGDDIAATVRTGFCDKFGGSDNGHNANYYLFRRVENFRVNPGPDTMCITSFAGPTPTGGASVALITRPARLYRLEFSDDLVGWQDAGISLEGYGHEATFQLTSQPATQRFYRIIESSSWRD